MAQELPRIQTGIEGFDTLCGGGLIRGGAYILSGVAGSGKTVFGLQYLYNGATRYGESGIYLTTEQPPAQLKKYSRVFGWNFDELEKQGHVRFIDATTIETGEGPHDKFVAIRRLDMEKVVQKVIDAQEELGAQRCVVDSSTSISSALLDPAQIRLEMLRLGGALRMLGLTSLIVTESRDDRTRGLGVEAFIADGVVILYFRRVLDTRIHSIEMLKMRGSSHSTKIHPFDITTRGILVNSREAVFGEF